MNNRKAPSRFRCSVIFFRKSVPIPHRVRGRLRNHALAALALAAGIALVPGGTFARGAGGAAGGARGPVFGLHSARIAVHRPIAPGLVRRQRARLGFRLNWWRLHRLSRHQDGANASYPLGGDGGYGAPADPNDVTGAVGAPGFMPLPPAAYPAEHVGCLSRGYDVPGESGGVAKVTVTRC
jgi:hypothetical protein